MKNNYNQSTTGINIETSIFLDSDLTQWNFDDNFKTIESDIFHSRDQELIYTNFGNLSNDFDFYISNKTSKNNLLFLCKYLFDDISELKYFDKQMLIDEIETEFYHNYYFEEIKQLIEKYDIKSFLDDYIIIESKGYSQGDFARVFINYKEYKKVTGYKGTKTNLEKNLLTLIDSMLWDCVITARLEINEEEYIMQIDGFYNNWECLKKYDVETEIKEVIKNFPKLDKKVLTQELKNLLPQDLNNLEYI
jgi:hypothetical protein